MSKNNFIRDDIQFFLPVTESNHLAKARFQCKREKKRVSNYGAKAMSYVSFIPFYILVFWSLLAGKLKNMKLLHNLCLQDGQDEKKKQKKNHATKVTKIPKPKDENLG